MEDRFTQLRREVLALASEDMTGVWEAWWRANPMVPELPLSERLSGSSDLSVGEGSGVALRE